MTIKGIVSDYQQEMTQKMIDEMMSDPNLIEKYAGNKHINLFTFYQNIWKTKV